MSDTIRFIDLAKKLGVGIDTIRRTVAKLGDDLGIAVQRESHSSRAQCLSITRKDCKLVMNEVYEGNLELLVQRADELFCLMPNHNTTVELSEHSPLRAKKTTPTVNPANPSR